MEILWIRHAEPERIESGSGVPADPALTPAGRLQAERLAAWLAGERIDVVYSSPQRRARETAAPIAAAHGLEVVIEPGIVEFDVHADHYIPVDEIRRTDPEQWQAMITGEWESLGGESADEFRDRVVTAMDRIIATNPGRRVAAVCHGGVVNCAVGAVLGITAPLWFDPHYTSLSRIVASRSGVRSIVSVNERAHLDGARSA